MTSPSSTSLLVTWDHPLPPDRNGVITNYTVNWQTGSEAITTELPSNDTSLLLTDLMPFTVYSITVAGSTSAGRGELTTPVTRRTRIDSEWKMGLDNVCVYSKCECCEGMRMVICRVDHQCPIYIMSSFPCSDPPPLEPLPTPALDDTGLTVTVPIVECSDRNGPIR